MEENFPPNIELVEIIKLALDNWIDILTTGRIKTYKDVKTAEGIDLIEDMRSRLVNFLNVSNNHHTPRDIAKRVKAHVVRKNITNKSLNELPIGEYEHAIAVVVENNREIIQKAHHNFFYNPHYQTNSCLRTEIDKKQKPIIKTGSGNISEKTLENKIKMQFNQEEFNKFVLANNVIGFYKEPITLKSGRESHWYVNWRGVTEDVFLANKLTDFIVAFTLDKGLNPECFYGVPEGATKTAILASNKFAKYSSKYALGSHCLSMGRGKPKVHGISEDRYFVGAPRGNTIVLEDTTTTADSLLETIKTINCETDATILAAFGLTNRMQKRDDGKSVRQALEEQGVQFFALSSALELLPKAYKKLRPGEEIAKAIEQEFEKYGLDKLTLID